MIKEELLDWTADKFADKFTEMSKNSDKYSKLKEKRIERKKALAEFLLDPANEDLRPFQAILAWARIAYKDKFVPKGELPEFHNIYAGFDQEACVDTFYLE